MAAYRILVNRRIAANKTIGSRNLLRNIMGIRRYKGKRIKNKSRYNSITPGE